MNRINLTIISLTLYVFKQDNFQEYQQMKRITLIFMALSVCIIASNVKAQSKHIPNKCSSVEAMEHQLQKHPELKAERENFEKSVQQYLLKNPFVQKSGNKRIIPVVFHIIHECGPENISRAQVLDQIRVMNEDFSLTNPNFSDLFFEQTPNAPLYCVIPSQQI